MDNLIKIVKSLEDSGLLLKGIKRKSLTDYTNLFSPNDFKKNDDTILKDFMNNT